MKRLARLLPLALVALPPVAYGQDPVRVEVPTEALTLDKPGAPPEPPRAGTIRANQAVQPLDLDTVVPVGVTALPTAPGRTFYGTLKIGESTVQFAARLAEDGSATLFQDANRDGTFDAKEEARTVKADDWKAGPRQLGHMWSSSELGGGRISLAVRERMPDFSVQVAGAPGTGAPSFATLSPTPPASVKVPATLAGTLQYGTAKVGKDEVVFAVARGAGDALTLVLDEAGKGDLAAGKPVELRPMPVNRGKRRTGTRWSGDPVTVAGHVFMFQAVEALADVNAMVNETQTRRGAATVGGVDYALYAFDGDLDGRFDGPEDAWWFGPRTVNLAPTANNMFPSNEPCFAAGEAWALVKMSPDGVATVGPAANAGDVETFLRGRSERVNARKWFPKFADDLEFAKKQALDESRPRAEQPVAFHFALSLAAAKVLAAKEGKPLLVDFEADWCVWCKRLDYHTYPDREVAAEMAKFCAVKINNELDPDQSFRQPLGLDGKAWNGIPAVAFFGPKGEVLPFHEPQPDGSPTGKVVDHLGGWRTPQVFAASLRSALGVYEDVKAGKAPPVYEPPKAPEPVKPTTPHGAPPATPPAMAPDAPPTPVAPPTLAPQTPPTAPK